MNADDILQEMIDRVHKPVAFAAGQVQIAVSGLHNPFLTAQLGEIHAELVRRHAVQVDARPPGNLVPVPDHREYISRYSVQVIGQISNCCLLSPVSQLAVNYYRGPGLTVLRQHERTLLLSPERCTTDAQQHCAERGYHRAVNS